MELSVLKVILLRYWKGKGMYMPFLFFGYRNEGAHPLAEQTSVRHNLKHPPSKQKFDFVILTTGNIFQIKKPSPKGKGERLFYFPPSIATMTTCNIIPTINTPMSVPPPCLVRRNLLYYCYNIIHLNPPNGCRCRRLRLLIIH